MLNERIQDIERRIASACGRAGRSVDDIRIVVVTKTQPPEVVNEAIGLGYMDIGENRVQEYLEKHDALLPHRFHMIGHVQRNKVRRIVGVTELVHSVDSIKVAEEFDRRSAQCDCITNVLLEVNSSGEQSKHGFHPSDVQDAVEKILPMEHIRLQGLMTVAALEDDPERVRPCFVMMRKLRNDLRTRFPDSGITELSMGMTNDFEVAIEEGATILRIGSAIFGPRA